ncbi:hypothetical protein SAY87_006964 [Trapa incisa]|uniref:Uncharacterized protein n=1 Tax=Trapa incisa TaxID=236973 RepID=A0AAN7K0H1_9MYRT|nr:hypothetical protein SAY87_006964 [Trapa incisa]
MELKLSYDICHQTDLQVVLVIDDAVLALMLGPRFHCNVDRNRSDQWVGTLFVCFLFQGLIKPGSRKIHGLVMLRKLGPVLARNAASDF